MSIPKFLRCKSKGCMFILVGVIALLIWYQSRRGSVGNLFGGFGGAGVRPYEGFSEIRSEPDIESGKCRSNKGTDQIMFFFMNGCPHCDKIKPEWVEYKKSLGKDDPEPREFEVSMAPNICKEYGVTGFPSFVLADSNGEVKSREYPF